MRALQEDEELDRSPTGMDTEITLGMRSLLGIFFGLVLVCGVFFGLGYSLGRGNSGAKSSSPAEASRDSKTATRTPTPIGPVVHQNDDSEINTYRPGPDAREPINTSAAKPAPQSSSPKPSASVVKQVTPEPPENLEDKPVPAPRKPTPAVASTEGPTATPKPASSVATPAAALSGAGSMVQVAAISRQEDAEILVGALKKRGYSAVIRNDPKDSLLHVQIGPFATRDEARAMRAKLLADGYNAILK